MWFSYFSTVLMFWKKTLKMYIKHIYRHTSFYCPLLYCALKISYCFYKWKVLATPHQASMLAPFFQQRVVTSCFWVTFRLFLQYFKLLDDYYICYDDL